MRAVRAVVSAAPQEDHAQAQATAAAAEEEHAGRLVPKGRSALRWRRQRGELAAYLAAEGAELAALDVPVGAESLVSPGSLCGSAMRNQDRSLEEVMQRGRWNQGGDQRNAGLGRGKGADGRTASGQWASRGVRRSCYAGNGGELHTAAWPRLSTTAQWAQRRAGTGSVNNNPRLLPSYLSYFGKFADLRTGQNWTFGVPNDLLCLSVRSKIIVDCGASSSRGAKAFTDGQRSGASGDPEPGRVWAQKSEALITASAHQDGTDHSGKGLYPPQRLGHTFQEHTRCRRRKEKL